jgi:hypothetical protein
MYKQNGLKIKDLKKQEFQSNKTIKFKNKSDKQQNNKNSKIIIDNRY